MDEPLTISNAPLEHPGMDYAFLRQEGIKLVEKLASSRWTDYNAHDPGITILEALCYAITDLSYRLSFSLEDLLAFPPNEADHPPLFLTARDILTVNPLTINDYRKLLLDIDIDGVRVFKNAWLEPIEDSQPAIFYDASNAKLTFKSDSSNPTERIRLKGLYRVFLEKEEDLPFQNSDLIAAARTKLNQHRNLCEDFAEIEVIGTEIITVHTEIEIADHIDANQFMAQLYAALDRAISPPIDFLNLPDLLNQGIPVEDIFVGPQLKHGFIDDVQLEQFQRKTELRTSDLIHVIMDLPGVKTVRKIEIASDRSPTPQPWALDLQPNLTPQLKFLGGVLGAITLYKGQIACPVDLDKVKAAQIAIYQAPASQSSATPIQDIPIPTGNYRELSDYETIQSEFPMVYGIGEVGLPGSASPLRKAQAKQLQAYLMVFDQVLANYFAQLDHVRNLFTLGNADVKTYFTQNIAHFPGAKDILKTGSEDDSKATQDDPIDLDRKNRLLDHLIAQYSETFIDYSLLHLNESLPAAIQHKAKFTTDYRQVSAERGQAINYTLNPDQSDNVSGLKQRIARLLGIEAEDFYVVEHILLRPRPIQPSNITQFSQSNTPGNVICTSPEHKLQNDEKIDVINSSHYNGTYIISNVNDDTFEIQANFFSDYQPNKDAWVKSELLSLRKDQHPDPFSFQITVVLPDSSPRLQDSNFQQVIRDTLVAETPAHITLNTRWFKKNQIGSFEADYRTLLKCLSASQFVNPTSKEAEKLAKELAQEASRLIVSLELGSTKIPPAPESIGYMVIGDASKGAPRFTIA